MKIIRKDPSALGCYPNLHNWPDDKSVPAGYYIWPENLSTAIFYAWNGFVTLTVVRGIVTGCAPNESAYEAWAAVHDGQALAARKAQRITESKQQLEAYLLTHPIQWTDGQYYAITAEKQQQLTSKIISATMAAQTGTPYSLTWNATGEECQAWTLQNLTALAFAIDARVTSLVSYQQAQEVAMRDAASLEELEAIPVDYDSVGVPV